MNNGSRNISIMGVSRNAGSNPAYSLTALIVFWREDMRLKGARKIVPLIILCLVLLCNFGLTLLFAEMTSTIREVAGQRDFSDSEIFIQTIIKIESSGNPMAFNIRSGARGLMQITPICLEEWNNYHQIKYELADLFSADINKEIGTWYLTQRIPQMLEHYGLPVNTYNIIWSYSAGIGKVRKGILPNETKDYILKYKELTTNKGGKE